jgi:putative hemolysin
MTDTLLAPSLDHLAADNLSLKVATTENEIKAAQKLRYDIFYTEMGAKPTGNAAQTKLDIDQYDAICQHLLVIDSNLPAGQQIVGTYRLLLLEDAQRHGMSLYTEGEFDLGKLKAKGGRIMEVSRSCVAETHRSKAAINLLWKGIAQYVFSNKVDYLVGVPSFPGTDIATEQETLAYLNAYHLAPEDIRPRAVTSAYQPLPVVDKNTIDVKRAFMALPPLLKGYLRVGAMIGDGAYIDYQFNTIDVVIVMPIAGVDDRYFNHYKRHDSNT